MEINTLGNSNVNTVTTSTDTERVSTGNRPVSQNTETGNLAREAFTVTLSQEGSAPPPPAEPPPPPPEPPPPPPESVSFQTPSGGPEAASATGVQREMAIKALTESFEQQKSTISVIA